MDELISVIVPIYNAERFLEKCIDSILAQSYEYFELLLVDDGSTDSVALICKKCMEKDSRVEYFYQKNLGVSAARNTGLTKAKGKYITFVDADDWVEEKYLERLHDTIKGKKLALCGYKIVVDKHVCEVQEIKHNVIENIEPFFAKENNTLIRTESVIRSDNIKGFVWRCLFKRDIIDSVGMCFNENVYLSEDLLFLLQYINVVGVDKIGYVEEYLYNYVQHYNSACSTKYKERLFENRKVVNSLLEREIWAADGIDFFRKENMVKSLRYEAVYEILSNEKSVGAYRKFLIKCNHFKKEGMSKTINYQSFFWLIKSKEYKKLAIFILFKLRFFCAIYILFSIKKKLDNALIKGEKDMQ